MTTKFDPAPAIATLDATCGLSRDALSLLRSMLQDAYWNEGKLSGRLPDVGSLLAWFELSDCGLVGRKGKNHFLIHYEKFIPQLEQQEAT